MVAKVLVGGREGLCLNPMTYPWSRAQALLDAGKHKEATALWDATVAEDKLSARVNTYCNVWVHPHSYGRLGFLLSLLYCAHLFASSVERKLCSALCPDISETDLLQLVSMGSSVLAGAGGGSISSGLLRALDSDSNRALVRKVVSSTYFRAEDAYRSSYVLRYYRKRRKQVRLQQLQRKKQAKKSRATGDRRVAALRNEELKMVEEYHAAKGVFNWHSLCGETSLRGDPDLSTLEDDGALDDLIQAIQSCGYIRDLMTRRPPRSILPHDYALLECMEHACLWMTCMLPGRCRGDCGEWEISDTPIYKQLPAVSYRMLRQGTADVGQLHKIYQGERWPCCALFACRRRIAIGYRLFGGPSKRIRIGSKVIFAWPTYNGGEDELTI